MRLRLRQKKITTYKFFLPEGIGIIYHTYLFFTIFHTPQENKVKLPPFTFALPLFSRKLREMLVVTDRFHPNNFS